jgi:hypothetical protein
MQPPLPFYAGIDFHIGLCPLADNGFNSTKQHTKALYYAARGVAPLCSPVGAYPAWCAAGGGLLASSWAQGLEELADPTRRSEVAAAARELAAGFVISKWVHLWEQAWT